MRVTYSVTLAGAEQPVLDVTGIGGEVGLPDSTAALGVTATILWATPWRLAQTAPGWPYGDGTPVTITVTVDPEDGSPVRLWRALTGVISGSSIDQATGQVTSDVVDDAGDRLSQRVDVPCIAPTMPPLEEGGAYRRMGLHGIWVAAHIAGQCGYYPHTPPPLAGEVMRASMCGSTWPSTGVLLRSRGSEDGGESLPLPARMDGTWGMLSPQVTYQTLSPTQADVLATDPWVILWDIPQTEWGGLESTRLTMEMRQWGNSTGLSVRVVDSRLYLDTVDTDGVHTEVASLPRSARIGVRLTGSSIRMITAGGGDTGALAHTMGAASDWATVTIGGTGVTGAIQAHRTTDPLADIMARTPSMVVRRDAMEGRALEGIPPMQDVVALDTLREMHEAERLALWVDELGRLISDDPAAMAHRPVAAVLSGESLRRRGDLRLLESTTTTSPRAPYREAVVRGLRHQARIAREHSILLQQGSGEAHGPDETTWETAYTPQDRHHWLHGTWDGPKPGAWSRHGALAYSSRYVGRSAGWERDYNRRRGTWVGGHRLYNTGSQDGNEAGWFSRQEVVLDWVYRSPAMLSLLGNRAGMGTAHDAVEVTSESAVDLKKSREGVGLPELRGMGKLVEFDARWRSRQIGSLDRPAYDHDAGPWVQHHLHGARVAESLAVDLAEAYPDARVVCSIGRVRLGERVQVRRVAEWDALRQPSQIETLDGYVAATDLDLASGQMTLSLRLTSISQTGIGMNEYGPYKDSYKTTTTTNLGCVIRFDGPTPGSVRIHANAAHIAVGVKSVEINAEGFVQVNLEDGPVTNLMATSDEVLVGRDIHFGPSGGNDVVVLKPWDAKNGRWLNLKNADDWKRVYHDSANLWFGCTRVIERG